MIEILRTTRQFNIFRRTIKSDQTMGLVPTMGNLHKGHLSLVRESLRHNDTTIVSIFVNPKQFGPSEDFEKYPRTLGEDAKLLKELYREEFKQPNPARRLAIFSPEHVEEIYPDGFSTKIIVKGACSNVLCGQSRPLHFEGVTTVVFLLFSIVKPHKVYFGQKDYQQYLIIKKMIDDLMLNIQIIPMPIKRDPDGLALSSRNRYLSKIQRVEALHLPKTLNYIKHMVKKIPAPNIYQAIEEYRLNELTKNSRWDYLEVLDSKTLTLADSKTHTLLIAGAYQIGSTRLIDNKLAEIIYA